MQGFSKLGNSGPFEASNSENKIQAHFTVPSVGNYNDAVHSRRHPVGEKR